MKNYQQTVKQRRANLEKAKRDLRHSNPKRVFHHTAEYRGWRYGKVQHKITNQITFRGHKL